MKRQLRLVCAILMFTLLLMQGTSSQAKMLPGLSLSHLLDNMLQHMFRTDDNAVPTSATFEGSGTHTCSVVTLEVDSEEQQVWTTADSVGDLLREREIELSQYDKVRPGLTYSLQEVERVEIVRVTREVVTEQKVTPYTVKRVPDKDMYRGQTKFVQKGQDGLCDNQVEITYENGVEVERKLLNTKVITEPQDEIVKYGMITTVTRGGRTYEVVQVIEVEATAYTAGPESTGKTPDHPEYGITASGIKVRPGLIAVDKKVIPLRTEVYVEGLDKIGSKYTGKYLAADTGSAIKGNKIDIYMEDLKEARRFGRRKVKVYILR